MSLRAEDSRKLLVKLVGTENFLGQQKLAGFFRSFLMTKVKTYIAQVMKANAINIFEIDENLTLFSDNIKNLLIADFADYGVCLERFFVTNGGLLQIGYTLKREVVEIKFQQKTTMDILMKPMRFSTIKSPLGKMLMERYMELLFMWILLVGMNFPQVKILPRIVVSTQNAVA